MLPVIQWGCSEVSDARRQKVIKYVVLRRTSVHLSSLDSGQHVNTTLLHQKSCNFENLLLENSRVTSRKLIPLGLCAHFPQRRVFDSALVTLKASGPRFYSE